jgi:hypothetical protein
MTRALLLAAAAITLCTGSVFGAEVVPLAHFSGIGLRGGGHVVLKHGTVQRVTLLKGSTEFTRFRIEPGGGLEIDACNANCPQHYDLEIEVVSPELDAIAVEGGGSIEAVSGFPNQDQLSVAVSGGGAIDARQMSATAVNAAVNGGGHIKTAPRATLHAAVNGGGKVLYWGDPSVAQAVSGGGSIERAP